MPKQLTVSSLIFIAGQLLGCVAQVRDVREQQPFVQTAAPVDVALVTLDVPSWVRARAPSADLPAPLLRASLANAFSPGPYRLIDRSAVGGRIAIGPNTPPIIQKSATGLAEVGMPYPYDDDGRANAVGAPLISWFLVEGPQGFEIAPDGVVRWTPELAGPVEIQLVARNQLGQTPYKFIVDVKEAGTKLKVTPSSPSAPNILATQDYTALLPPAFPPEIKEPLVLGVQVVDWREGSEAAMKTTKRKAFTDVVYTLWTREGEEVETTRVRLEQIPLGRFREAVHFVPDRPSWQKWSSSKIWGLKTAPMEDKEIFQATAEANAAAFAFPYGVREINYSAQLEDGSPALTPGIELSNKDDFAGALAAFEALIQANPSLPGAHYNAGVMLELLGQDQNALDHYTKAKQLDPSKGLYERARSAVFERLEAYRRLPTQKMDEN